MLTHWTHLGITFGKTKYNFQRIHRSYYTSNPRKVKKNAYVETQLDEGKSKHRNCKPLMLSGKITNQNQNRTLDKWVMSSKD